MKTFTHKFCTAACLAVFIVASPIHAASTNDNMKGKYHINVKMHKKLFPFPGDSLLLRTSTSEGVKPLQTVAIIPNDSLIIASFDGSISGNTVAYLSFKNDDHFAISFILEPGKALIHEERRGNYNCFTVDGTPLNDLRNAYAQEVDDKGKPFEERIGQLKADKTLSEVQRGQRYADILTERAKAEQEVTDKYIVQNKDNALGAMLFLENYEIKQNDLALAEKYWKILSPNVQKIKEVADRYARVVAFHAVKEGDMFRDFTLKQGSVDGKEVKLSDYVGRGRYVLVDFWASWCGACRYGIPNVKTAYAACKNDNFDCLSIAVWDKRPKALQAIKEEAMPWTQFIDEDGISGRTYGISAIPRVMLFSPDGHILKLNISREDIVPTVTDIVKGKK